MATPLHAPFLRPASPPSAVLRRSLPARLAVAVALVVATVATLAGVAPGIGVADPAPSIAQVQARVDQLAEQVNVIAEQYNAARDQLAAAHQRSAALEHRLDAARHEVGVARQSLDRFAAAAYRSGGNPAMALILDGGPQAFLDRSASLSALSNAQAARLTDVRTAQQRLDAAVQGARRELAVQQGIERRLKAQRDRIGGLLHAQQQQLDRLRADQRAELARQRAAAAAQAVSMRGSYDGPATGQAGAAVRYAYAQLGKPYVWGAAGPDAFDCSGLTMQAWAAGGVALPHNAAAQYADSHPVPMSALQPGDLVFRGSPAYHVAIYIGNGQVIAAPHTGDVVRVQSVSWFQYAARP